jgi:hypothetical protein
MATTTKEGTMFEIHVDTYHVEEIPVIEAKDAYEAAIMYAARFAPCAVRRIHPEVEGDMFIISAIGSDEGVEVEVFVHDGEAS